MVVKIDVVGFLFLDVILLCFVLLCFVGLIFGVWIIEFEDVEVFFDRFGKLRFFVGLMLLFDWIVFVVGEFLFKVVDELVFFWNFVDCGGWGF